MHLDCGGSTVWQQMVCYHHDPKSGTASKPCCAQSASFASSRTQHCGKLQKNICSEYFPNEHLQMEHSNLLHQPPRRKV